MISRVHITAWRATAPWSTAAQVEKDLVLSCALVEIFSDPVLNRQLAFRGGTALYKLQLIPAPRYSEDTDLERIDADAIASAKIESRRCRNRWIPSGSSWSRPPATSARSRSMKPTIRCSPPRSRAP